MKKLLSILTLLCIISNSFGQNNTGNYWKVWYPEVINGTSDAPNAAFAVTAADNSHRITVGSPSVDACNSYTIGNDRRGYVYYDNNSTGGVKLIRIVDPATNTVVNNIDYSAVTPSVGILHTINSFYISATNKHYLVVSGIGAASVTPDVAVYIFDVSNVLAPTFVKSILLGSGGSLVAFDGTSVPGRVTGLVLQQTTYTSGGVTMYAAIDNLKRSSAPDITGTGVYPGVFAKITDPLSVLPIVSIHDAMYNTTNYFAGAGTGSFGPHQIALDETNNILYLTNERNRKILAFNVSGALPTATNIVYSTTAGSATNGFHGISVTRDGSYIYVAKSGRTSAAMSANTDKIYKYTRQTVTGTYDETSGAAAPVLSPELSVTADPLVKGANLTPDEQYLYAITFDSPAKVFSLNKTTLALIGAAQNPNTNVDASFQRLDPHSYAFTLHDYGDAPISYGKAPHNLVNQDYILDRLRIGATIDGDTSITPSNNFNGDDIAATPRTSDEDGISAAQKAALSGLWNGRTGTYSIGNIPARNMTANSAKIIAWIDFDHSGTFDADEASSITVPINTANRVSVSKNERVEATSAVNFSWTIPSDVTSGPVNMRFRISTDASLTTSAASITLFDGEAEDHTIPTIQVSGNIFNDINANTILSGENNISNLTLYAYLIKDGIIIDAIPVNPDGTYTLPNGPQNMGTGTVLIGTNLVATGSASSGIANLQSNPPIGYVYTGESSASTTGGNDGILTVNLGLSPITDQNFGLQQPPQTAVNLQPSQVNPGGTASVTLPQSAFQTSNVGANPNTDDPSSGTVVGINIPAFPTGATSITVGGTTYLSNDPIWGTGGITIPYTDGVGPNQTITVDPALTGTTQVVIPITAIDNAGAADPTPGSVTVPFTDPLILQGTVYHDITGLSDNVVNDGTGLGNPSSAPLYANLLSAGGTTVIATVLVNDNGTYVLPVSANTTYIVQISTNQGTAGQPTPATALPAGWMSTGDVNPTDPTATAVTPGLSSPVEVATSNMANVDFGIQQPPQTAVNLQPSQVNPGGTVSVTLPQSAFQTSNVGANPNTDDPSSGTVVGINIPTFPTGATSITVGGTTYLSNDPIWGTGGITIPYTDGVGPNQTITVDPALTGTTQVVIPITAIDNAGAADPTPGSVTVPFTDPLPVVLVSFEAKNGDTFINLVWKTANEKNFDHFEVQRSGNAKEFRTIAIVTSRTDNVYNQTDNNPIVGINYYRLKMVDLDGSFAYSRIKSIDFDSPLALTLSPNPATNMINLKIDDISNWSEIKSVRLYDLNGRMVYSASGLISGEINVSSLTAGAYAVAVTYNKGTVRWSKIVIVK